MKPKKPRTEFEQAIDSALEKMPEGNNLMLLSREADSDRLMSAVMGDAKSIAANILLVMQDDDNFAKVVLAACEAFLDLKSSKDEDGI